MQKQIDVLSGPEQSASPLPGNALLSQSLSGIVAKTLNVQKDLAIVSRENARYQGVNMTEIITCESAGKQLQLFCKYGQKNQSESQSHRVGVEYEARVYDEILKNPTLNSARYYGMATLGDSENILMVIKFRAGYSHLDLNNLNDWGRAAAWVGNLHRVMEGNTLDFLRVYSRDFYLHWVEQFKSILDEEQGVEEWIYDTCAYYKNNIDLLTNSLLTVIHGEFYVKNILIKEEKVCVIDWESTAIASGEIDLAALIDNSSPEIINKCIQEYMASRWPDGVFDKAMFEKKLNLSRMYYYFRWLSKKKHKGIKKYLETEWVNVGLRSLAEESGCVK